LNLARFPLQGPCAKKFDCITAMKALGEENRLRLVRMLLKGRCSVNAVVERRCEITQYNVSKHLRVLMEAGLLEKEKQGQQRLYAPGRGVHQPPGKQQSCAGLGLLHVRLQQAAEVIKPSRPSPASGSRGCAPQSHLAPTS